jgi:hypothetical protein
MVVAIARFFDIYFHLAGRILITRGPRYPGPPGPLSGRPTAADKKMKISTNFRDNYNILLATVIW